MTKAINDNVKRRFMLYIDPDLFDKFKALAVNKRRDISTIISEVLSEYASTRLVKPDSTTDIQQSNEQLPVIQQEAAEPISVIL